jgi:hypothetical protein
MEEVHISFVHHFLQYDWVVFGRVITHSIYVIELEVGFVFDRAIKTYVVLFPTIKTTEAPLPHPQPVSLCPPLYPPLPG